MLKDYSVFTKLPWRLGQKSAVHESVGLSGLSIVLLVCLLIFMLIPHWLSVPRLCSFSKLFWHSRSFASPYKFQNKLVNFYKLPTGILTDITLNLEIIVEFCHSRTWYTSAFIQIFFNFSRQCFVVSALTSFVRWISKYFICLVRRKWSLEFFSFRFAARM